MHVKRKGKAEERQDRRERGRKEEERMEQICGIPNSKMVEIKESILGAYEEASF